MRNTLTVLLGAAALAAGLATAARPASAATSMSLGYYDGQVQSGDTSGMDAFPVTSATVIHYNCWTCTFPSSVARTLWADGHTRIFVEMESWNDGGSPLPHGDVPVTDITAGEYDSYLARFADAVAAFGHPVYLTFDHEMNGDWYPWGWHGSDGITPAQWQSAWIHVRSVINAELTADTANVQLVKWVWAPNVNCGGTTCTDLASYYPGDSFVAVKGLDGYLNSTSDTYLRVFGSSVTDERGLGRCCLGYGANVPGVTERPVRRAGGVKPPPR